jgi:hypothetical protein
MLGRASVTPIALHQIIRAREFDDNYPRPIIVYKNSIRDLTFKTYDAWSI